VQLHLAAGASRDLFQKLPYPYAVSRDIGHLRCRLLRVEEVQVDRLLQTFEDAIGAGRGGVEMVRRQVQPPTAQGVIEENRQADEKQGQRQKRAAAEC
jgi:hypothetical protein